MTTHPADTASSEREPSPGIPAVYPTAPITVSRDTAGYAWLALIGADAVILSTTERAQATQELFAALWPETITGGMPAT